MKNLTPEMIEKAKAAKSAEELLPLAKEYNIEMTADEAKIYYAQLNPKSGELDDDDLDSVAGGACAGRETVHGKKVRITSQHACPKCGGKIGTVMPIVDAEPTIFCDNCCARICHSECCTFEVIGSI